MMSKGLRHELYTGVLHVEKAKCTETINNLERIDSIEGTESTQVRGLIGHEVVSMLVHTQNGTESSLAPGEGHSSFTSIHNNFSCFGSLPPELQDQIWDDACDEPRCVPINICKNEKGWYSAAKVPASLHVCRRSRERALKKYSLMFGGKGKYIGDHPPKTYFNPFVDTLLIRSSGGWLRVLMVAIGSIHLMTSGHNMSVREFLLKEVFPNVHLFIVAICIKKAVDWHPGQTVRMYDSYGAAALNSWCTDLVLSKESATSVRAPSSIARIVDVLSTTVAEFATGPGRKWCIKLVHPRETSSSS
ncbi:uncharacterized protein PAC_19280 [Phialocephala subalpina]|uniref:2EXR domain-containing protein n=1 Tax=Phialocephala subalpina TaxID=576137 RepID=A0A1L7XWK6_9HELO|nr:uncharacterized protein PAC_19280 [Phialocephala subalpina]